MDKKAVSQTQRQTCSWKALVSTRYLFAKTARRHGLNTDASFRYERGTDPNIVIYALKLAAMMIKEVAGGKITCAPIDIYPEPVKDFEVSIKYAHVDRLIGKKLTMR